MKTSEILQLDCREANNRQIIQKVLRKVKPLADSPEKNVPLPLIEKLITLLSKKYSMSIKEFVPDVHSNSTGMIWRATITNDVNFQVLQTVHGLSVYEVFAKSAIYMYSMREKIDERR